MGVELDPDLQLCDARLAHVLGWWRERCDTLGRLPGRQHFDPTGWVGLLPQIYLVDILDAGRRYRFRLIGTGVTAMAGRDATGRYMDELYGQDVYSDATRSFGAVLETARPMRSFGTLGFTGRDYSGFETIEVPLAADGRHIDVVLGMTVPTRAVGLGPA